MNKKWLALALKIAVSGGLIWYLVDSIDLEAAGRRIIQVDPIMMVGAAPAVVPNDHRGVSLEQY